MAMKQGRSTNSTLFENKDIHNLGSDESIDDYDGVESRKPLIPIKRRHSTGTFEQHTNDGDNDNDTIRVNPLRELSRNYSQEIFIHNVDAINCSRFYNRRNALCDPLRLLITQCKREQLEHDVEKRKTSVTRKISQLITVSLDLNRDEELI